MSEFNDQPNTANTPTPAYTPPEATGQQPLQANATTPQPAQPTAPQASQGQPAVPQASQVQPAVPQASQGQPATPARPVQQTAFPQGYGAPATPPQPAYYNQYGQPVYQAVDKPVQKPAYPQGTAQPPVYPQYPAQQMQQPMYHNVQQQYYPQYNAPASGYTAPPLHAENKKEFFIGVNLLSKIGVIFIIIGVIAFSAVSANYISPLVSTIINFVLGVAMVAIGEVFYRLKSVIFARALTIGGLGELAVSILIGYGTLDTLNEYGALLTGLVIAAGGLALALRYRSQTVMVVAVVCGFLHCFVTLEGLAAFLITIVYLIAFQTAVVILCGRQNWFASEIVSLVFNLIIVIPMLFYVGDIFDSKENCAIIITAYIILSCLVYQIYVFISAMRNGGYPKPEESPLFIAASVMMLLISLISLSIADMLMIFGFVALFFALVYIALSGVVKAFCEGGSIITVMLNIAITCVCLATFTIFSGPIVYVAFHVCAAGLLIIGILKDIKFIRRWGIITCAFAEYYFLMFCLGGAERDIFILQFAINVLLWLIIMAVCGIKRTEGAGFKVFSVIVCANTALFGVYMISRLTNALQENNVLHSSAESFVFFSLFSALIWMIAAFATGKLRFIKPASHIGAIVMYSFALLGLFSVNLVQSIASVTDSTICVVASIIINIISIGAALDLAFGINSLAPKFSSAIALTVTAYAMLSTTLMLNANHILAFTSCIISIVYLAVAVVWIVIGFIKRYALMRRFGLALTLLAAAKLFLFDFTGIDAVGRTLMFILFGIILLGVSFIYAAFEKKLKKQEQEEQLAAQMQMQAQMQAQYYNNYNNQNTGS